MASSAGYFLSPQQRHIWSTAPHARTQIAVTISGAFDETRLRGALFEVVKCDEALRTVFQRQTGMMMPFQVILEECEPSWNSRLDEPSLGDPARSLETLLRAQAQEPMSADGSQLRSSLTLFQEGILWILSAHAAIADRYSMQLLVERVIDRYAPAEPTPTPEDALRYVQFAQWQNDQLAGDDDAAKDGAKFWEQSTTDPETPPYPSVNESHTRSEHRRERLIVPVGDELTAIATSIGSGVTVDDVLLAAWTAVFARWSGQQQVETGLVFSGRDYEELAGMIGSVAKTCPLSVTLSPQARFDDSVVTLKAQRDEAANMQEYYAPSKTFRICYESVNLPAAVQVEETSFAVVDVRDSVSIEAFKLDLRTGPGSVHVTLEYRPDIVPATTAAGIAEALHSYIVAAVANAHAPLILIPMVSNVQREQLLTSWNMTEHATNPLPVHRQIRHVCSRFSGDSAVRSGAFGLSYGELEGRANSLGRYLAGLGVKRGSLVGLCVSRSAQMMVAVLAILKAGAAYVPLGADQPKARLAQQLAGIEVLLTEAGLTAQLSEFTGVRVILDDPGQPWQQEAMDLFEVEVSGDDLAYVIYTSGSTGAPKGVAVRHRNLSNYAGHIVRTLELDRERLIYATVSTLTADLGNTVLYPALLTGGCLHILPYDVATDGRRMASYQLEHGIDVLKIVPSHLAALLDSGGEAVLPKRLLITGGEALKPALVERVLQGGSCEMINHYGPTETTVGSLMLRLNQYDWKHSPAATIPIGRPIANTRVYVLDANRQLVPVGVAGELYIAGAGVTAGYLGQPGKTAERFLDDPFQPPATMYRTGDLVRWLPDGVIEFLGRTDDQVKIRGFRVELGEIETILAAQPGVRHSCVLARPRPGDPDDQQIVAYTVLDRQLGTSIESLRHAIQDQLPDYMVPAAIVALPRMPLTPNGKIDRKALPEPDQRDTRHFKPPATITEELVANVWQEVLKITQLSTDENFFDLGGHSLLATQVVSRLRERLHVEIPLRAMFENPILENFARELDATRLDGSAVQASSPIRRVARREFRAAQSTG